MSYPNLHYLTKYKLQYISFEVDEAKMPFAFAFAFYPNKLKVTSESLYHAEVHVLLYVLSNVTGTTTGNVVLSSEYNVLGACGPRTGGPKGKAVETGERGCPGGIRTSLNSQHISTRRAKDQGEGTRQWARTHPDDLSK